MSISDLEIRGVKMPPPETFLDDLTAAQIVEKINSFHMRLCRESHLDVTPFAETYFLNLMALYPVSMCSKTMTEELKLVAALFYFGSQPSEELKRNPIEEDPKFKELFPSITPTIHRGYSLDDLALIFDRNKACIADAIEHNKEVAKIILEEASLRSKAEKVSVEQIIEKASPAGDKSISPKQTGPTRTKTPC
jgi:hypothetical protein